MKYLFGLIFLISIDSFAANSIIGSWKFAEYNYEGENHPRPNPNLDLRFSFDKKGYSILQWLRTDEEGFCRRLGSYHIEENEWLVQKTLWVDPENDASCATDLEMHVGYRSITAFKVIENELHLTLALNGKDFIYIFTPVE